MTDVAKASNWSKATEPDDQLLELILMLIVEWIDVVGRPPTVGELRHAIRHPGS